MRKRSLRDVRDALFLNPYQLSVALALFVVTLVFVMWPEALDHDPIAFQDRGTMHHTWHYTLLVSSFVVLWAMVWAHPAQRVMSEILGLLGVFVAMVLTFIELVAAQSSGDQPSGLFIGLLSGLILALAIRIYCLIKRPMVQVSVELRREE